MATPNIKSLLSYRLWLVAGLLVVIGLTFAPYMRGEQQVNRTYESRHEAFLLIQEIRQSFDGIARLARRYLANNSPQDKNDFLSMLANRAGNRRSPPDTEHQRQSRLNELELIKLSEIQAQTDQLAALSLEAVNLADTDPPKAQQLLNSSTYLQTESEILKRMDEFSNLIEQRTIGEINAAEHNATVLRCLIIVLGIVLAMAILRNAPILPILFGASIAKIRTQIAKISGLSTISNLQITEGGIDSRMSATKARLEQMNLERKDMEEKLHRTNQLYAALSQCNQAVVRCTNEDDLFRQVCRAVVDFGGMRFAWIGFADPETRMVVPVASLGHGEEYLEDLQISVDGDTPLGRGPTGTAIRENTPYWCQDFIHASATSPWHDHAKAFGWRASASLPLQKMGVPVGAITLYADAPNAFDESARNLLLEMADDISFALDNFAREAARQQAEQALKESLAKTQLLLDSSLDAVVSMDHNGLVIGWSQQAEQLFGYTQQQAVGQDLGGLIVPPEYRQGHYQGLERFTANGTSNLINRRIETIGMRADGSQFPIELTVAALKQQNGYFFSAYIRNISERKQAEADLRIAATAFESQEGMMITDDRATIIKVNRAFSQITGYSADEAVGQSIALLKSGMQDEHFYQAMQQTLSREKHWQGEIWNRRKNGETYPEWLSISAVSDDSGRIINYVGAFSDMTQYKKAEETIHNLAFYDPLTSLPNRRLLLDRLNRALATTNRRLNHGAVLFVDLDKFKELNDTSGHNIGDLLLVEVAKRLQHSVHKDDTVAHLGGDDFVIMLENLSENTEQAAAQAEAVAERILGSFNQPFALQEVEYFSSTSIGISLFRNHGISIDDLLKHTETAMYQAKQSGRNTIRFFDPSTHSAMESRIALSTELRRALPENQLKLYYQIQVAHGGEILGAETLIRWQHPEQQWIPPNQFIPLAEESGLILSIGQWVLETACAQLKAWEKNPATRHLQLAVNVSASQFRQPGFVDQVLGVLEKNDIDPINLKLELTESMVLTDVEEAIRKMRTLKEIGVHFSLDDFGTGYSSLAYLTQLPLDQLKIDQSFVRNIGVNYNDAVIVQTIIGMADNLGIEVIAEGVETVDQRNFLQRNGCYHYQGYLFGKPMPLEEFEQSILNKPAA